MAIGAPGKRHARLWTEAAPLGRPSWASRSRCRQPCTSWHLVLHMPPFLIGSTVPFQEVILFNVTPTQYCLAQCLDSISASFAVGLLHQWSGSVRVGPQLFYFLLLLSQDSHQSSPSELACDLWRHQLCTVNACVIQGSSRTTSGTWSMPCHRLGDSFILKVGD